MIEDLMEAIRCCRDKKCDECPMQEEICDQLRVAMLDLPEELVEKIEEELNEGGLHGIHRSSE